MATIQEIMAKNKERLAKNKVSEAKPNHTKIGAEELIISPTSSLASNITPSLSPKINRKSEPDSITESGSLSESGSKNEPASKMNLANPNLKERKFKEAEEYLSRDENRLLKYIREKVIELKRNEVAISKSELVKFANINLGRLYSTRTGLLEKGLITMKESVDDKNRKQIFYSLREV